ncbi:hypothetical protein OPKNFCMD_3556 [Methylobacterium crusticola]|uniref:Uncharacterized protein n=1 Tax=Methylobacterium crusticola TaxID=1697972 RepID=A0ABQ4R117_9HYPH|nr:hypothetical protein OPKNFCMD_3556 [Methylobacterium crusticola]
MPVSVREVVPEPVTATPDPAVAASVPLVTPSVTLSAPVPASTSATLRPVSASGVSSLTANEAGRTFTGASSTGTTVIVVVAVLEFRPPSLTVTATVRAVAAGLSDVDENWICRRALA